MDLRIGGKKGDLKNTIAEKEDLSELMIRSSGAPKPRAEFSSLATTRAGSPEMGCLPFLLGGYTTVSPFSFKPGLRKGLFARG